MYLHMIEQIRNTFKKCMRLYSSQQLYPQLSYFHKPGELPLFGETMGQTLEKTAQLFGNNEGVVFCETDLRKSYAEFNADVDKFAAGLLAIGLQKGDRLGIWSPNKYEWVVTQWAAAKAGLILVLINPAYQPRELEYCLNKVAMRALVSAEMFKTQDYYKMLSTVVRSLPESKPGQIKDRLESFTHVIMMGDKKYGGSFNFHEVANCGQSEHVARLKELDEEIQFDDPGTTGAPKGATLSHFNILNNAFILGRRLQYHKKPHRICIPVPLYHAFGCVGGTIAAVLFGACQVYPAQSFDAKLTYQAVHNEKCTSLYGTPTMYIDIFNVPNLKPFPECKTGVMGGATCPVQLMKICMEKLNMSSILIGYGSTECSPGIAETQETDSLEQLTTTVGSNLEHTEIKLVDPISLRTIPIGEIGELWVRGYCIMRGYWNDKGRTSEVITKERWYRTGDLATVDAAGYFKIVGRIKDMIIRGGENIYPREIEEYLHTNPKIAEAHVVGVPDERLGDELCAWIRVKPKESLTEEEVKTFCKGKLAHFKIPRYVKFVDKFPMTVTGKVQKFIIREQATSELKLDSIKSAFITKEEN